MVAQRNVLEKEQLDRMLTKPGAVEKYRDELLQRRTGSQQVHTKTLEDIERQKNALLARLVEATPEEALHHIDSLEKIATSARTLTSHHAEAGTHHVNLLATLDKAKELSEGLAAAKAELQRKEGYLPPSAFDDLRRRITEAEEARARLAGEKARLEGENGRLSEEKRAAELEAERHREALAAAERARAAAEARHARELAAAQERSAELLRQLGVKKEGRDEAARLLTKAREGPRQAMSRLKALGELAEQEEKLITAHEAALKPHQDRIEKLRLERGRLQQQLGNLKAEDLPESTPEAFRRNIGAHQAEQSAVDKLVANHQRSLSDLASRRRELWQHRPRE